MFLVWLAYYREVAIGSLFIKKKECDIGHTPSLFSLKHLSVLDSIQDKRL